MINISPHSWYLARICTIGLLLSTPLHQHNDFILLTHMYTLIVFRRLQIGHCWHTYIMKCACEWYLCTLPHSHLGYTASSYASSCVMLYTLGYSILSDSWR